MQFMQSTLLLTSTVREDESVAEIMASQRWRPKESVEAAARAGGAAVSHVLAHE